MERLKKVLAFFWLYPLVFMILFGVMVMIPNNTKYRNIVSSWREHEPRPR